MDVLDRTAGHGEWTLGVPSVTKTGQSFTVDMKHVPTLRDPVSSKDPPEHPKYRCILR